MNLFDRIKQNYKEEKNEMSIQEYLELCAEDKLAYASPAERMLAAIGEPEFIDTKDDDRLNRIFFGKTIKRYPAFSDFYGMEETIDQIVSFFKHAAQGLEEKKQVLYLLGPVGGGKSSLAERIKLLMENTHIYVLKAGDDVSPVLESPLTLFSEYKSDLEEEKGIPKRYIPACMSPWAIKRLQEFGGDINKFKVVKMKLSIQRQIGIAKTEPGDENNQDISTLVGKVDISKLAEYAQDDADAYSFSGALCKANQGIMEFVEMFKAPIKVLHPLLTATQEGNYNGTEAISSIPFNGVLLAHSNESEWETFSNDSNNEAFLDRIYVVRVPYSLRINEEVNIYEKLLSNSELSEAPCAPQTLEMLAKFSILTRISPTEHSNQMSKMRVYNGEDLKDVDPKSKSIQEYKDIAGVTEGMAGISTRFAFKVLSKVFNYDQKELAANPVHLLYILEKEIIKQQYPKDKQDEYLNIIKELSTKYAEFISEEIQKAYVDSYDEYGQNIFDRYVVYADHWTQDLDYRDEQTGEKFDKKILDEELSKIEKPAGIANPKDFRNDIVQFYLRSKSQDGIAPKWNEYAKMRTVIEKRLFSKTEDILPVISFTNTSKENDEKHQNFVDRMGTRGYTNRQIRLLVEWYLRVRKREV
ncbi:MAG: serine kinase [uncultured marine phage]|uniref:Serine kinase n=1 Tax=uncultured marine phage TaxID=707152 RepID=A0A8D9FRX9_9VIRU|nr:MAG: serine kinase [uncultured marine phage]